MQKLKHLCFGGCLFTHTHAYTHTQTHIHTRVHTCGQEGKIGKIHCLLLNIAEVTFLYVYASFMTSCRMQSVWQPASYKYVHTSVHFIFADLSIFFPCIKKCFVQSIIKMVQPHLSSTTSQNLFQKEFCYKEYCKKIQSSGAGALSVGTQQYIGLSRLKSW